MKDLIVMHETDIANSIIKEAKKHGNVKEISLEIGELAHVPKEELLECLSSIVTWKINYIEKLAKVMCSCGFTGHPTILERGHDFFMIVCPSCKNTPELIEGKDIKIKDIVID